MRRMTALYTLAPWLLTGIGAWGGCAQGVVEVEGSGGQDTSQGGYGGEGGGAGLSGSCSSGDTTDCYGGPAGTEGVGRCAAGTATCQGGVWGSCLGKILPRTEICDGEDDDCDGEIDQDNPDGGEACATGEPGPCNAGISTCVEATVQCLTDYQPVAEQCNAIDDDCSGLIDDGNPGGGASCTTGLMGICAPGTMSCVTGQLGCVQTQQASAEACDNLDNDCNGSTDDGNLCQVGYSCVGGECVWICPYVYAHDGSHYAYETSVGGAGMHAGRIGEDRLRRPRGPTLRLATRFRPLWARLDRARIGWRPGAAGEQAVRGTVRAKLLAAEDEIVYLRRARLAVVEHPAGYEVLTETSADWTVVGESDRHGVLALETAGLRPPVRASWCDRVDVTTAIAERTDQPVAFDRAVPNYYELDFGPVRAPGSARLVIDGWKFREPRGLSVAYQFRKPCLEVAQADGSWREVMRVPSPRGDRKAVVVDLAGLEWPTGRYRLRLWTGTHQRGQAMWYIDRVRLTEQPSAPVVVRRLESSAAELVHSGPPTLRHRGDTSRPRFSLDDGRGRPTPAHRTVGRLTRLGDVRELVASEDERLVVMQRGDAVELEFDGLSPTSDGRLQTCFLDVELVYKPRVRVGQADHGADAAVEPLPYAERADGHAPDALAHERYLRRYQTRVPGDRDRGAARAIVFRNRAS